MSDGDWQGEPHTLIVTSVQPSTGWLDEGELEYEIQHPPSCKQTEEHPAPGVTLMRWECAVEEMAAEGLAFTLRYSGTPITEPGTYQVQAWGTKSYYHEFGAYEYDAGVAVMDASDAA